MANGNLLPNGNGENGSRFLHLPLWAKIVTLVGPVGAIAFYLVWMGAQTLPHIDQEIMLSHAAVVKNQEMLRDASDQIRENYRLLIRLCVNTSKTQLQSDQCFGKQKSYE
jgi:hypothetical protein